jgi:hypothetical protein
MTAHRPTSGRAPAEQRATHTGNREEPGMVTRRRVLTTGLSTAAAVSGTVVALRPMLAARNPADAKAAGASGTSATSGAAWASGADGVPGDHDAPLFDEIYRGRRIQGFRSPSEAGVDLYIDGRPLHVMRRVDGSWISMANHFQPFLTPLATARGAVDVIGRAPLTDDTERAAHQDH